MAVGFACALGGACGADAAQHEGPLRARTLPVAAKRHPTTRSVAIRTDVALILIPITVTDPFGAPYLGLTRESFRLFEDGVEQQLKYFTLEDSPVSFGIVFDGSRSMDGKLDQSRAAVARVLDTAVPRDEFFLVEFNSAPRMLCNFTSDPERIAGALWDIVPRDWTALCDAVYLAAQQMKRAKNSRKALLILSDGGENSSRYTQGEMWAFIREAGVCIYSIGLGGGGLFNRPVRLLNRLSEETGGLSFHVPKMSNLPEAIEKISKAIRSQYVLGYSSTNPKHDGLYRRIEVRLNQSPDVPRLRASWRAGYYAPVEP